MKKAFCLLLLLLIFGKSFSQLSDWEIVPVSFKMSYKLKGPLKSITEYNYGYENDSLELINKKATVYDRQGCVTSSSYHYIPNNKMWYSSIYSNTYDEKGDLIEQISYTLTDDTMRDTNTYFYSYDVDRYLVKDSFFQEGYHVKILYEYGAQKKLIKGEEWNFKHNTFEANYFLYDSLGRLCKGEAYEDSVLTREARYTYDSNNNLITINNTFFADGQVYEKEDWFYKYDGKNNCVEWVIFEDGEQYSKQINKYNEWNQIVEYMEFWSDTACASIAFLEYDSKGNRIIEKEEDLRNKSISVCTSKYDSYGNLIEQMSKIRYADSSEERISRYTIRQIEYYE